VPAADDLGAMMFKRLLPACLSLAIIVAAQSQVLENKTLLLLLFFCCQLC
jgi:hypothetical protein